MSDAPKPQPPKVKPVAKPSPKALGNPVLTIEDAAQIALMMSGITHKK